MNDRDMAEFEPLPTELEPGLGLGWEKDDRVWTLENTKELRPGDLTLCLRIIGKGLKNGLCN